MPELSSYLLNVDEVCFRVVTGCRGSRLRDSAASFHATVPRFLLSINQLPSSLRHRHSELHKTSGLTGSFKLKREARRGTVPDLVGLRESFREWAGARIIVCVGWAGRNTAV